MSPNLHAIIAKILVLWLVIAALIAIFPLPSAFATGLILALLSQPLSAYHSQVISRPLVGTVYTGLVLSALGLLVWLPLAFPTNALNMLDAYLTVASTELGAPPSWVTELPILGSDIAQQWSELADMNAREVQTMEQGVVITAQTYLGVTGAADWVALVTIVSVVCSFLLHGNAKWLLSLLSRVSTWVFGRPLSGFWWEACKFTRQLILIVIGLALFVVALTAVMYLLGGVLAIQLMTLVSMSTFFICVAVVAAHVPFLIFNWLDEDWEETYRQPQAL